MPNLLELLGLLKPKPKFVSPLPDKKARGFVSPLSESDLALQIAKQNFQQSQPSPTPPPSPTPIQQQQATPGQFGIGQEPARVEETVFDALMALNATDEERRNIAELTGQESSYGFAGPHISDREQSFGPVHINIKAGRINPVTGKKFTKEEAENVKTAIEYALSEYRKRKGLGAWNPGAYDFYQEGIPERAKTKKFIRGR